MRIRNKWIELTSNSDYTHWCFYYSIPSDDCDSWNTYRDRGEKPIYRSWITIGFWRFFFKMYLWKVKPFEGSFELDNSKRYGFTFFERSVHIHWSETKVYSLPWDWDIVRHDLLMPDGRLYWRNDYAKKGKKYYYWYGILECDEHPYPVVPTQKQVAKFVELVHHTRDGRKQVAKIRLTADEREWRWKWFKWLPWPNKKNRVVDCHSDIELGDRAGEWKGGLMGWSTEWKKDESLEAAFWRWYRNWNGR
jgi:hypothetical protein